jgi:hypothetical protein
MPVERSAPARAEVATRLARRQELNGAIGPFVYRLQAGHWTGQSDAQLLDHLEQRLGARGSLAEAKKELGLDALRNRALHPTERELFAFLQSPEGEKVDLRYHSRVGEKGNFGSWKLEEGSYRVDFGVDLQSPTDRFLGPRTRYQVFLHELSHTMDGVADVQMRRDGLPNPIRNYAHENGWRRPPHQLLFQELRANLFATAGDFDQALALTRQSYAPGRITPDGLDLDQLSPRRVYQLAQQMTDRYPADRVTVTPDLLQELAPERPARSRPSKPVRSP